MYNADVLRPDVVLCVHLSLVGKTKCPFSFGFILYCQSNMTPCTPLVFHYVSCIV